MTQTKAVTTIFDYRSAQVRVLMCDESPWFVAKDVCAVLGLSDVSQAVHGKPSRGEEGLDDDERGTCIVRTPGGPQSLLCVSESGLYRLIFKSRKDEAKAFRRWLTHDVLPAIRTTATDTIWQQ